VQRSATVALVAAAMLLLGGCRTTRPADAASQLAVPADSLAPWNNPRLIFGDRLAWGYLLVLPGVGGGDAPVDSGVVVGLKDANVRSAIELYDWTDGQYRWIENLRDLDRNQAEARKIAAKILFYQKRYPGRPVHVIGYSGGGGVAVLALEALPPGQKITGAILLAPTLAFDYDLRAAMSHTERGLLNYYSPLDAIILTMLATAAGTTDGRHTLSAGAVGFQVPKSLDRAQREAYQQRLFQQAYQFDMLQAGHPGGHFGWANPAFIAKHVAPLVEVSPDAPPHVAARNGDHRAR
jgi:pimeloyl-ACP methyl ester carboxylesterase